MNLWYTVEMPETDQLRPRALHLRSQVTNGKKLFLRGDGNSPWARRFRDLISLHCADLGGADRLSEAQKQIIRRMAALAIQCEEAEARMSLGEEVDMVRYASLSDTLHRMSKTLGLNRIAKQVDPVEDYLKRRKTKTDVVIDG